MLKLRSVNSMVIAPARTGRDNKRRIVVIIMDHTNSGIRSNDIIFGRIFRIVVMKLIAPKIDLIPAK